MSAPRFTLTIPAAESGDMIAAVLRATADDFAAKVDGLTPPTREGVVNVGGRNVATWEVTP